MQMGSYSQKAGMAARRSNMNGPGHPVGESVGRGVDETDGTEPLRRQLQQVRRQARRPHARGSQRMGEPDLG